MTSQDLAAYLQRLLSALPIDRYVERRFTAVSDNDGIPADLDTHLRGIFRDREPGLRDVLKHTSALLLAEPGGGKSMVARAAIHHLVRAQERVPIFCELKEYRGDLAALMGEKTPAEIIDADTSINGKPLPRAYVLDGIDEIPAGLLPQLATDLRTLLQRDPKGTVLLTARQAFYAAHRNALPSITSLFYLLDFSDKDIADYVSRSNVDTAAFVNAVQLVDAQEEIRNPFILSIMVETFRQEGALSERRSDNISYMIDRLIESRRANRHQQRRVLKMLAIALETYSRNELTEEEAFRVIKQATRLSDEQARALLGELYASILRRTTNGITFQMRSYGEYLAAEELEDESVDRVKELAFPDYRAPNDSWLNTVSYLVELNSRARAYFVHKFPLWTISASPAAFSEDEKTAIVMSAIEICVGKRQYLPYHPLINTRKLSRFVTAQAKSSLVSALADQDDVVRGSALVLLGILASPEALPLALSLTMDRSIGDDLRHCGVLALIHVGTSDYVPELLARLDSADRLHINILDMVGAIMDESQIPVVLPLILRENAMLSAAYYRFREFNSRDAVVHTLRCCLQYPDEINTIRAEGYVEPIVGLLPKFFDDEIAGLCADLLEKLEARKIYPDRSGPLLKFFDAMAQADNGGNIARIFLERVLRTNREQRHRLFVVDQALGPLVTESTARWLVDQGATDLIQEIFPSCRAEIREIFRPQSAGAVEAYEVAIAAHRAEQAQREETRNRSIKSLQEKLLSRTQLNDALNDFFELKEDYWPELPDAYSHWLSFEVSKAMSTLDLEHSIEWKGDTLWEPRVVPLLLKLVDRYALIIKPDEMLVFVLQGLDSEVVAKYHKRSPLSASALGTLERVLKSASSPHTLQAILRFLESSEIWSPEIGAHLRSLSSSTPDQGELQITAMRLLVGHGVDDAFVEQAMSCAPNPNLREYAFDVLVERNHRPTIERALARVRDDDLTGGNTDYGRSSPLGWLVKIKSNFAWDKLVALRARALHLELPAVVGLITEALARIDRLETASVIQKQVEVAPASWRTAQIAQVIEQERTARIEAAQKTPFDAVLKKLRGATSINRLKVLCEGATDRPVFKSLVDEAGGAPDIIFASVGGWGNLRSETDPNNWLLGCKEAIIVMDGDEGRHLTKRGKPYKKSAKEETSKLSRFPIKLLVLERYGIENYFPRRVLERVIGTDLSGYFPVPDDVSLIEHLSQNSKRWGYHLRKFVARVFNLRAPSSGESLYTKSRNADTAKLLSLNDVTGTDLFTIIQDIANKANQLADE